MSKSINNSITFEIGNYLLMICTIFQCSIFYQFLGIEPRLIDLLWEFSLISLIFWLFGHHQINVYIMKFLIIFSLILIIDMLLYYVYQSYPIHLFIELAINPILLIMLFGLLPHSKRTEIFYIFENIMIILATSSIIFLMLYYIGISPNTFVKYNWGGQIHLIPSYFYMYVLPTVHYKFLGIYVIRNTGIFPEGSDFSYMLVIALLIQLFLKKHIRIFNWKVILLFVVIFTTCSTTGIILSILAIFYAKFILSKNRLFLLLLIPGVIYLIKYILFNKVSIDPRSSYSIRSNDVYASIQAWKQHLLIGNGLNNDEPIIKYMNPIRLLPNINNTGVSTGFFEVLAQGGIIWGLYYIIPTILSIMFSSKESGLAIFCFIMFIFVGSQTYYIYIIILSYFISCFILMNNKA